MRVLPSQEVLNLLKEECISDSEQVRYAAVKGLRDRSEPLALELALSLFQESSFYVCRAAAMTAISMGHKEGIPILLDTLQFETLDTTENYGDNVYQELARYVGVNFGTDKQAWRRWWQIEGGAFEFRNRA